MSRALSKMPLVVVALGCGPGGLTSLDSGGDETGGDETGGDDGVAPQLISARTDETGKHLLLRFSEPMAPPTGVDPSDFRISYAWTYHYVGGGYDGGGENWGESHYLDPQYYLGSGPYGNFELMVTKSVTMGEVATELILEFEDPMSPDTCDDIAQVQANFEMHEQQNPEFEGRAGLFTHYSPGATPVRSAPGEPLLAIGPEWVEFDGSHMYWTDFDFPHLTPQIPIDCIIGD